MNDIASAPARKITALTVLGADGAFARHLPSYEARPQQLEVASLIERGIAAREHVVTELATGGGKSFAALVPAVLSGQKVVYSTYMRSLQGQISEKDAPFLAEALEPELGRPISYAVLKGRGNYACLSRMQKLEREGARSREASAELPAFAEWVGQQREAEDVADVDTYPGRLSLDLRLDAVVGTDECTGRKCSFFDTCFGERAKRRAHAADIVIANHKLVCLDAQIRETSEGFATVLPDYAILICDEAHQFESVIRDSAGYEVTAGRLKRLGWMLQKYTIEHPVVVDYRDDTAEKKLAQGWAWDQEVLLHGIERYLDDLKATLERDADSRERRMGDERETRIGDPPLPGLPDTRPTILAAARALVAFGHKMDGGTPTWLEGEDRDAWLKLAGNTVKVGTELATIVSPDDGSVWVRRASLDGEEGKTRVKLEAKPIDVAPIGARWFFDGVKKEQLMRAAGGTVVPVTTQPPLTVISMSATVATSGTVRMFQDRVGCPEALTAVCGSPFDYQRNALLYLPGTPADLVPAQKKDRDGYERYMGALAAEMRGLALDAGGGAFLLFTSRSAMHEVHARIGPDLEAAGLLVLKQGEMSLRKMIQAFKEDGNAVLFGLKTFGEGVDIQGDALRLVAIDKVPFSPPTDVIWKALCDHVDRNGGNSFRDLSMPSAIITLKQFAGRLIRSKTDRGVMALLDGRVRMRNYGREVIANLPPAAITSDPARVGGLYGSMRRG